MSRKKNIPSRVLNYDELSDELKALYDAKYAELDRFNIFELREKAAQLKVESPTTLAKDDLVKRITDWIVTDYLPKEKNTTINSWDVGYDENLGETVRGVYAGGRVGNVTVSETIELDFGLREGDFIEGKCTETRRNGKSLISVRAIDSYPPNRERPNFDNMSLTRRRDFPKDQLTGIVGELLPDLQKGERVLYRNLTLETAGKLAEQFRDVVTLYINVMPEEATRIELSDNTFIALFDFTFDKAIRVANTAVERAKRLVERGSDVILIVHGLFGLENRDIEHKVFGSGRCLTEGSLTVIADPDPEKENGVYSLAATRII